MMKKLVAILTLLVCSVAMGGTIDYPITLVENPTTGYEWTYAISDEAVLTIEDNGYTTAAQSAEPMVGVGGTHIWAVGSLQEGEASITFTYARSWESEPSDPVVVYTFSVDAEKNLMLLSTEGMPEQYMPNKAVIRLLENRTTGYQWDVAADKDGILTLDSDSYVTDETFGEMTGVGGVHTWVYSGSSEGTVVLTFRYARSFEPDETPAAIVTFTYAVDAQLDAASVSIDGDYAQYDPDDMPVKE